ncbi:liver carboxylesterase-like [Takifugu rubripes]|uniref:liver carboxylesterase-like n=1 Tax=Takifugu rubripes TaxID=31033 RepID=UPI001145B20F|nr:liver carboxylesterase-like [Takifugu rubripes]
MFISCWFFGKQLLSPLSEDIFHHAIAESGTAALQLLVQDDPQPALQPKDEQLRKQILDEYTGTGEDRVKNRDGLIEVLGDVVFVIPAIKTANAHRDAGAPVYLYEFQHSPSFLKDKRPSFVKSGHGDEIFSVFGFCFTVSHIKLGSKFYQW